MLLLCMTSEFIDACTNGNLPLAKEIYNTNDIDIHSNEDNAFIMACANGHLPVAKWLYSLGGIDHTSNDDHVFRRACTNGHLRVAMWLYHLGGVDDAANYREPFHNACTNGHLEVLLWLTTIGGYGTRHDGRSTDYFCIACENGHEEIARWIHSMNEHCMRDNFEIAFEGACDNDNVPFMRWICENGEMAEDDHEPAFYNACRRGHNDIAKMLYLDYGSKEVLGVAIATVLACQSGNTDMVTWLYESEDMDKASELDIHWACENGNEKMFDFLISWKKGITELTLKDEAFAHACKGGSMKIINWIYALGGVNINANDDKAFYNACVTGRLPVTKWLYNVSNGAVDVKCKHDGLTPFQDLCIKGSYKKHDTIEWLYSIGGANADDITEYAVPYACREDNLSFLLKLKQDHPVDLDICITSLEYSSYNECEDVFDWIFNTGYIPPVDHNIHYFAYECYCKSCSPYASIIQKAWKLSRARQQNY